MEKIPLKELLDSKFWTRRFYQAEEWLWQSTSFQPVGGMDAIGRKLRENIETHEKGSLKLRHQVTKIERENDGKWSLLFANGHREKYDIVISNIPLPLLKGVVNYDNFSNDFKLALEKVVSSELFRPLLKVGWQAERKLWQEPTNPNDIPIFGGISYTSDEIAQMWYPSNDFHDRWGTLTGAYNYDNEAVKWGTWSFKEREEEARKCAANLHGTEFAKQLKNFVTIAWQNVKFCAGGYTDWSKVCGKTSQEKCKVYNDLVCGDQSRSFYIVGDQLSHLPAWKEGAISSAENAVAIVTGVEKYVPPKITSLPDADALVMGPSYL